MDCNDIKTRLGKLSFRKRSAIAVRAAAMVLPLFTLRMEGKEPFWYWKQEYRAKDVLAIFRAINVAWFVSLGGNKHSANFANVANAAAFAATKADTNTIANAAANATAFAATNAAGKAVDAAAFAFAAAAADATGNATFAAAAFAADAAGGIFSEMLDSNLLEIENCLDPAVFIEKLLPPSALIAPDLSQIFSDNLRSMGEGFDFWADWYEDRLAGKPVDLITLELIVSLPEEILSQGPAATNAYLKSLRKDTVRPLNRVRAIFIGHGEAGKTSVIRALHGEEVVAGKEPMTPGIEIREWLLPDSEIKAHFWDFGGQVMAHATHQFFLRERCLYVLVIAARTDINANQQAEYWLEHIRAFGNEAPVLLVGNKTDLNQINLDLYTLRENYPNIKGFFQISCTGYKDAYQDDFTRFTTAFTAELKEVGMHLIRLKEPHFAVLEALQQHTAEKGEAFLAKEKFNTLCDEHGVPASGELDRAWLLDLLDKLGLIVHFSQLPWMDKYVLNPRWLTYGVYTILYSEYARKLKGRLTEKDVMEILHGQEVHDNLGNLLKFDAMRCHFIVEAMRQFQLCYRLPHDNNILIIPDLLPSDRPEKIEFDEKNCLVFDFDFEGILPRHLMSGFIARRHEEIGENPVWQNGVQIRSKTFDAVALARANYNGRRFSLWVSGEQAGRYFPILYDEVKQMLKRMPKLPCKEWVRLPGQEDHPDRRANFLQLLAMEEAGEHRYIWEYGEYDLADLLKIMPADKRREGHQTFHIQGHYFESVRSEKVQFGDTFITNHIKEMNGLLGDWQDKICIEQEDERLRGQALRELDMIRTALSTLEKKDADKEEKHSAVEKLSSFGDRLKDGASKSVEALKGIKDSGEAVNWLMVNVPTVVEHVMKWLG